MITLVCIYTVHHCIKIKLLIIKHYANISINNIELIGIMTVPVYNQLLLIKKFPHSTKLLLYTCNESTLRDSFTAFTLKFIETSVRVPMLSSDVKDENEPYCPLKHELHFPHAEH